MENSSIIKDNIPRNGLTKECQKLIPYVVDRYKEGKSNEDIKRKFRGKNRAYVEEIYKRTELTIKNLSLDKISKRMYLHREDIKHGIGFVDTILRYCVQFKAPGEKLEKRLVTDLGVDNNFLKRRYKDKKYKTDDVYIIKDLEKNQKFYLFVAENIILNNKE